MSSKKVIASSAAELTENESGCQSITATPPELSEGCCAIPVTGCLDTPGMTKRFSSGLPPISRNHLLYRC